MPELELFSRQYEAGVFRGFTQGGLEFHADLLLPYQACFHNTPMHGQFLLVQLETPEEAVLGRIASFAAEGKLSFGAGEEFALRAMHERRPIPDDLREEYLRYRVSIRVLGVLRIDPNGKPTFVPSHRRLPHVGSIVAFPSPEVLKELAGHNIDGAAIGHFALGEYIYAHGSRHLKPQPWMQLKDPEIFVRFPMESLVSRRSFIFARAGFGKSNLNKLLFSRLYAGTPTVEKRGGRRVPVGTIIFDPDGEYFWPDDKGRPGLCDVPELEDRLVVFTARESRSPFYQSFVASGVKLDIRRLRPTDVIAVALSPEKQDQQNVRKLRSLNDTNWRQLVDLIHRHGNNAPVEEVSRLLHLERGQQDVEAYAARSNMTQIVKQLHDPASQMMQMLLEALAGGKLCIVDVSQMRGSQGLTLSGLILRQIFNHNQEQFTEAEPKTIPTIAVIEEAQSVLDERASAAEPYVEWVKEGRKYDLGALMITQQPGSIPVEILSQGDNWFIFHLLSAADLASVQKANAHFSDDLLCSLLNEPIPGQGVFWSSVGGTPYPVPVRVLSFEDLYGVRDAQYERPASETYAFRLRERYRETLSEMMKDASPGSTPYEGGEKEAGDVLAACEQRAVQALQGHQNYMAKLRGEPGLKWGALYYLIHDALPEILPDREQVARGLVRTVLERTFGSEGQGWETRRVAQAGQKEVVYVRALKSVKDAA
jgi:uncharacterized protein DUF87